MLAVTRWPAHVARVVAHTGRSRLRLVLCLLLSLPTLTSASALAVLLPAAPSASAIVVPPGVASGSQVHAVIQVETSPAYAGDQVLISSTQLQASCGGTIVFETLQGGSTTAPTVSVDSIVVALDDDGNVTVVVDGGPCAPGTDLVEADLTGAPYLTAVTTLDVEPPQVTPVGVSAYPSTEVETGNSPASGESDVYVEFYVETSPVYAEQPVAISSPELDDRCGGGWRWEPGSGSVIDQASGTTVATGTVDDDGNATFVFKGASCAAGTSTVTADVEAGDHPTYTTTLTVDAPQETLASTRLAATKATKKRRHTHHAPTASTPPPDPPSMTVTASPDPLVETGVPAASSTLDIVKSDDDGGSSSPPTVGDVSGADSVTYTITVSNSGPSALDGVVVSDPLSADSEIASDTFSAAETGGASGFTASETGPGVNDIDDTVDLPAGSSITYTVDADLDTVSCGYGLSNTATLTPPAGAVLSPSSITSATDTDTGFVGAC